MHMLKMQFDDGPECPIESGIGPWSNQFSDGGAPGELLACVLSDNSVFARVAWGRSEHLTREAAVTYLRALCKLASYSAIDCPDSGFMCVLTGITHSSQKILAAVANSTYRDSRVVFTLQMNPGRNPEDEVAKCLRFRS